MMIIFNIRISAKCKTHIRFIFPIIFGILLNSCQNNSPDNANFDLHNDEPEFNAENISPLSSLDSDKIIKAKLKYLASVDTLKFLQQKLYDDYFKDDVKKYSFVNPKDSLRWFNVVVYKDKLRYLKVLLMSVNNTDPNHIKNVRNKFIGFLDKEIKIEKKQKLNGGILSFSENNESWYSILFCITNISNKKHKYYLMTFPKSEYNYLLFWINYFNSEFYKEFPNYKFEILQ